MAEQTHDLHFFVQSIIKQLILVNFFFLISNNQGLSKVYPSQPFILDITKISFNDFLHQLCNELCEFYC